MEFTFQTPLKLPAEAKAKLSCLDALIWNTSPNVFSSGTRKNNSFYVNYNTVDYRVDLIQGIYDLTALNASLNIALTAALPGMAGLISLTVLL